MLIDKIKNNMKCYINKENAIIIWKILNYMNYIHQYEILLSFPMNKI